MQYTGRLKEMKGNIQKTSSKEKQQDEQAGSVDQIKKKYGFSSSNVSIYPIMLSVSCLTCFPLYKISQAWNYPCWCTGERCCIGPKPASLTWISYVKNNFRFKIDFHLGSWIYYSLSADVTFQLACHLLNARK